MFLEVLRIVRFTSTRKITSSSSEKPRTSSTSYAHSSVTQSSFLVLLRFVLMVADRKWLSSTNLLVDEAT